MSTDRTDPIARAKERLSEAIRSRSWAEAKRTVDELADACEAKDAEIERLRAALKRVTNVHNGTTARAIAGTALWPTIEDWKRDCSAATAALSDTGGEG